MLNIIYIYIFRITLFSAQQKITSIQSCSYFEMFPFYPCVWLGSLYSFEIMRLKKPRGLYRRHNYGRSSPYKLPATLVHGNQNGLRESRSGSVIDCLWLVESFVKMYYLHESVIFEEMITYMSCNHSIGGCQNYWT